MKKFATVVLFILLLIIGGFFIYTDYVTSMATFSEVSEKVPLEIMVDSLILAFCVYLVLVIWRRKQK